MARMVEAMPNNGSTVGRRGKYPWKDWLNGSVWELHKGADFDCSILTIRSAACYAAMRRGKRVSVQITDDAVFLQARPKDG